MSETSQTPKSTTTTTGPSFLSEPYGLRSLWPLQDGDDLTVALSAVENHHHDTALYAAAHRNVRISPDYRVVVTVRDGITYLGWTAEGSRGIVGSDPDLASRDDLLLGYDRLSREAHE
jgi:hypothetical protein